MRHAIFPQFTIVGFCPAVCLGSAPTPCYHWLNFGCKAYDLQTFHILPKNMLAQLCMKGNDLKVGANIRLVILME